MERILSQDEINALFSTMSSGNPGLLQNSPDQNAVIGNVVKYDFCKSDRISKDLIRSLHMLHSHFSRSLSASLSNYLRNASEVTLSTIEQVTYGEFLKRVQDPTLYCAISFQPMRGTAALEISPSLCLPMIDLLLGGPGSPPSENRPLTEIESNILEGVVGLLLRDLKEAWRSVIELDPKVEGVETKPTMLQLFPAGEAVVAVEFDVKMAQNQGRLQLCLPSVMLKMNRARFDQHGRPCRSDSDGKTLRVSRDLIRGTSVPLTAEIHEQNLLVEDLLSISVGDIIRLDRRLGDPVFLCVGGIPKFRGRIVVRRGKKAFEIVDKFDS